MTPAPRPWYREPWPWLLIGLVGSAVIGSVITLVIALVQPDERLLDEHAYQRYDREFKADPDD